MIQFLKPGLKMNMKKKEIIPIKNYKIIKGIIKKFQLKLKYLEN